jgi:ribosomal-protein-alanine N-acetyltransferase
MALAWLRSPTERALHLEHGRVYLRPPRRRDWRTWSRLRAESRAFLVPWEPTWPEDALTRRAFRRRLQQYNHEMHAGQGYSFLVFRQEDRTLLGGISLTNVRRGVAQSASLGYWIGRPHARQGYMAEALTAVVDFAFERLKLHRVEAACLPENVASQGLLRKVGFTEEGYARGYLRINGTWQDHVLFALLNDDARGLGVGAAPRPRSTLAPPQRARTPAQIG